MKTDQSNDASVIAVIGATGSGKGVYIKNYALRDPVDKRLVVWDYMREYAPLVATSSDRLSDTIRGMGAKAFRLAFTPSYEDKLRAKQFDAFCRAAVEAGDLRLLVEELAFVTKATHAPAGWKMATSIGRHKGLRLIGASQRPAQVDKAFWSNCTEIHCGFLNYEDDQKVMAKALQVSIDEIQSLKPLEYIHRNVRTKENVRGFVKF